MDPNTAQDGGSSYQHGRAGLYLSHNGDAEPPTISSIKQQRSLQLPSTPPIIDEDHTGGSSSHLPSCPWYGQQAGERRSISINCGCNGNGNGNGARSQVHENYMSGAVGRGAKGGERAYLSNWRNAKEADPQNAGETYTIGVIYTITTSHSVSANSSRYSEQLIIHIPLFITYANLSSIIESKFLENRINFPGYPWQTSGMTWELRVIWNSGDIASYSILYDDKSLGEALMIMKTRNWRDYLMMHCQCQESQRLKVGGKRPLNMEGDNDAERKTREGKKRRGE